MPALMRTFHRRRLDSTIWVDRRRCRPGSVGECSNEADEEIMSSITTDLAGLLDTVNARRFLRRWLGRDFHAVPGSGRRRPIALPLLPVQAEHSSPREQAPYGRGEETVIDTNVRRTWQLTPPKFGLVVALVARPGNHRHAGCRWPGGGPARGAELYKLLYTTRQLLRRASRYRKSPGMFATLVIVLPSLYTAANWWCATATGSAA